MATIRAGNLDMFMTLQDPISEKIAEAQSFDEASQIYVRSLYETFHESIVLIRQFATVPYEDLPQANKAFVIRMLMSQGSGAAIRDQTLVLSLCGSYGVEPAWRDRGNSQGHIGIPLISADFIDAIPMPSRLLKQLGLGLNWIDSQDTQVVTKTLGSLSGVFFVQDARNETDLQGRKIITAEDFVDTYHVRTVFGFGGGYLKTKTFIVTVIFLREAIEREKAEEFAAAMAFFKAKTASLIRAGVFE